MNYADNSRNKVQEKRTFMSVDLILLNVWAEIRKID